MGCMSKILLDWEKEKISSIESRLLICNKNGSLKEENQQPCRKLTTTSVLPSPVLGRVKDFLGIMAEANKKLELSVKEDTSRSYDIEVLAGDETEHIEMDLVLGVADLHTPEAVAAAENAMTGSNPPFSSSFESESDSDDTEDDTDIRDDKFSPTISQNPNMEEHSISKGDQSKKRSKITEVL